MLLVKNWEFIGLSASHYKLFSCGKYYFQKFTFLISSSEPLDMKRILPCTSWSITFDLHGSCFPPSWKKNYVLELSLEKKCGRVLFWWNLLSVRLVFESWHFLVESSNRCRILFLWIMIDKSHFFCDLSAKLPPRIVHLADFGV